MPSPRPMPRRAGVMVLGALVVVGLGAAAARVAHRPHARRMAKAGTARTRPGPALPGAPRSPIGYNLDYPGDWSQLRPFIDLMHNARPWSGACAAADPHCDSYRHLVLDAQGWPRTLQYRDNPDLAYAYVEAVLSTTTTGPDLGQVFVASWEGEGDLEVFGGEMPSVDKAHRRLTFKLQGGNTIVRILRTDPRGNGSYLRNLRVFRQDYEPLLHKGETFNPEMLAFLEPFGSLRFMDWMLSNDVEDRPARWSERPRPESFPWIRQPLDTAAPCNTELPTACRRIGGYPVEVLVELANRLGANPHFNMPYRADDGWIKGFAVYVRDHLARRLRATVEYSNEVWNWGFPQATYARLEADKLGGLGGSGWLQYMGARAAQTCRLWKTAFAGQEQRVQCVIAPQTAWVEVADQSLDCPGWVAKDPKDSKDSKDAKDPSHRPCYEGIDAVAISGYFGGDMQRRANNQVLRTWLGKGTDSARDQAFRYLEKGEGDGLLDEDGHPLGGKPGASAVTTIALFKRWQPIAEERGLALYVYEGGTHFGSDEPDLRAFFASLTTDPRMFTLYRHVLDGYRQAGGTVWNAWGGVSPGDAWGNAESLADRSHPKYRALVEFAKANPCCAGTAK